MREIIAVGAFFAAGASALLARDPVLMLATFGAFSVIADLAGALRTIRRRRIRP